MPYQGMKRRTVREIKRHVTEAPRRVLLGMLRDELRGKRRKSVLALLLRRARMNAIQLWSRDDIREAARALEIRLDPQTWRGEARLPPEEAYRRLVGAGLTLFTRTGRNALRAFLDWLMPCEDPGGAGPLRDSAQGDQTSGSVRNPGAGVAAGATGKGNYACEPP